MTKKTLAIAAFALGVLLVTKKNAIADAITENSDAFSKWDPLLKQAASRYGIADWRWLKAIIWNESDFGRAKSVAHGLANPEDVEGSKSSDGKSWGLTQTTLGTANDMRPGTTVADLNNPAISIDVGAKYFAKMLNRYKENQKGKIPERAVRAYNQGPGNEDRRKPFADPYLAKFVPHFFKITERNPT